MKYIYFALLLIVWVPTVIFWISFVSTSRIFVWLASKAYADDSSLEWECFGVKVVAKSRAMRRK